MAPPAQQNFTLSEAATILGVSVKTVKRAVKSGDLAVFNGGQGNVRPRWFVTQAALTRYISKRKRGAA